MLAFLHQQVGYHPDTLQHLVSEYGDPEASPDLLYIYFYVPRTHDLWHIVATCIVPTMDQFHAEYRYAQHSNSVYSWVDIQITIDKSRHDNVQTIFSTISDDIGLDDKFFKIYSGKEASAIIKWNSIDDHTSCCEGCFSPEALRNRSMNVI